MTYGAEGLSIMLNVSILDAIEIFGSRSDVAGLVGKPSVERHDRDLGESEAYDQPQQQPAHPVVHHISSLPSSRAAWARQ